MIWKISNGLDSIQAEHWDALVGENNPFVEYAFLSALEQSESVGIESGWLPMHITIWEDDVLIGAAPTYVKDNSYGEYIFDWSWAELSHRIGLSYYPKIVVAVPFTPATGPRLLYHPDADKHAVWSALVEGLYGLVEHVEASSVHVLFCLDEEAEFLEKSGLCRRATHQFHWRNNGYEEFSDYLAAMRSASRKQIRKERRQAQQKGLTIELLPGEELDAETWDTLFRLYRSTTDRKWGQAYLTRSFFTNAPTTFAHRAWVGLARKEGRIIAGTLSFAKGRHVYGRYWGAFEPSDGLHFEMCYYQLIDFAIRSGCSVFEAGAQGAHKIKRGLLPTCTHSAHFFVERSIRNAFEVITKRECIELQKEIEETQSMGPFKQDCLPPWKPIAGFEP